MLYALLLLACTTSTGTWEGECTDGSVSIAIQMELEEQGGEVTGDVALSADGVIVDGDVEGERDQEDLDLDMEFSMDGTSVTWAFDAELDGDDLEGTLDLEYVVVDCALERD